MRNSLKINNLHKRKKILDPALPLPYSSPMHALLMTLAVFVGFQELEPIVFHHKPQPLLVKPKREVVPIVWMDMLKGTKRFEGFYSRPYVCPAGIATIGYGHTKKIVPSISKTKASQILEKDLEEAKQIVLREVKVPLSDGQVACLTTFTFNCGIANLRKLVNGPDRLNSGNYDSIKRLLPLYAKANGKTLSGLKKRRKWELTLWENEGNFLAFR